MQDFYLIISRLSTELNHLEKRIYDELLVHQIVDIMIRLTNRSGTFELLPTSKFCFVKNETCFCSRFRSGTNKTWNRRIGELLIITKNRSLRFSSSIEKRI